LIAQQLGDGAAILYYINMTTVLQATPPDAMLGRMNATMRVVGLGAQLADTLLSGIVAEMAGLRAALAIGACANFAAAAVMAFSPVAGIADANHPVRLARETSGSV
jgi:hypothetical protein